jgi:hypothetical protein
MSDSPRSSRLSLPPAEPRLASRPGIDLRRSERASRIQMGIMLVFGLLAVAIPLYLWRRPKTKETEEALAAASASAAKTAEPPSTLGPIRAPATAASSSPPAVEVKVLSCLSKGKRKPGEECDHVTVMEEAFAKASTDQLGCLSEAMGGESVLLTANVGLPKKRITVTATRPTEKTKLPKAVRKCTTAIREAMLQKDVGSAVHAFNNYRYTALVSVPKKEAAKPQ